jgi:hypothetical protein
MSAVEVDHLVVACATLERGVAWCEATLGVTPAPGGRHEAFGTHNRLVAVSSEGFPDTYLELIAIDPEAPPPARARWFGLDDTALQARLAAEGPRLLTFVGRSTMLDMHRWGLITLGQRPGEPVPAERTLPDGRRLAWQFLVPPDGALLCGGALPPLIQWATPELHPAKRLPAQGVALRSLRLFGLPARVKELLRLKGVPNTPERVAGEPALRAMLDTPLGPVVLDSF